MDVAAVANRRQRRRIGVVFLISRTAFP